MNKINHTVIRQMFKFYKPDKLMCSLSQINGHALRVTTEFPWEWVWEHVDRKPRNYLIRRVIIKLPVFVPKINVPFYWKDGCNDVLCFIKREDKNLNQAWLHASLSLERGFGPLSWTVLMWRSPCQDQWCRGNLCSSHPCLYALWGFGGHCMTWGV